ncbi:MAG: acyl-CoA thioesterase [Acidobacteria bacterium]|nr:acyl-CoA thioesterase [Acidobacteriota bacterium]
MLQHTTQIRVRYAETDQMGVVYHANYVVWMEVGRVEAMRSAGLNYAQMEREGVKVAVLGVEVDYRAAARYDDLVNVTTRVVEVQSRKMRIEYEIHRDADGQLLATGATRHLFINAELKPVRCPDQYLALFTGC